ncbi:hypothetical protein CJU90_5793 [Yarrowia sp. C11]|nr:hypothetical protein CJU90_5793 [Yarrowia sp. C11]KAG5364372.1 hypothetical protein CKK34_3171 [Yarrowia sp. E02]
MKLNPMVLLLATVALASTITTPPPQATLAPRQDNKDDNNDEPKLVTKFTANKSKNTYTEEPPTLTLPGMPTGEPVIPYTENNPYVNTSKYPEGTVFICVGSILGGLTLLVMAWRFGVAWHMKKQIKKANAAEPLMAAYHNKNPRPKRKFDHKSLFPTENPFGEHAELSMDNLSPQGKSMSKSQAASMAAHKSSLFFSPTAEVMNAQKNAGMGEMQPQPGYHPGSSANSFMGFTNSGNRSTAYLPSGYYGPQAGQSNSMTSQSRASMRGSMLAPSMAGGRANSLRPMSQMDGQGGLGGVRAPSAFLDDMLKDDMMSEDEREREGREGR